MEPEERQEVEELLEFSGDSAAGRMTTDYIALPASAVSKAIEALREFEGDIEMVTDIYLLDDEGRIASSCPWFSCCWRRRRRRLQVCRTATSSPAISTPMGGRSPSSSTSTTCASLPVLEARRRLVGVIHAEQVIALLRANH